MTISIIIPVFQCKPWLRETVDSVLQAGLPLEEILLVDDGSTDGSAALCDELAVENPLFRCIHKENGGVSSARNIGIEIACGDYLWFIDSDDTVQPLPHTLYELLSDCRPNMVMFGMSFDYWSGGVLARQENYCAERTGLFPAKALGEQLNTLFACNYLSSACNKLFYRKSLIENRLRFREDMINYEDLEFVARSLSCCDSVCVLAEPYYHYRILTGKDHTAERVSRIPDLMGNTDYIAAAFFRAAEAFHASSSTLEQIKSLVLSLYLDLFQVRLLTLPLSRVEALCEDFASDEWVRQCANAANKLSSQQIMLYQRILNKKVLAIWLRGRYQRFRRFAARIIKPIIGKA